MNGMSSAIQAASRRLTAEQRRGQLFAVALELFDDVTFTLVLAVSAVTVDVLQGA